MLTLFFIYSHGLYFKDILHYSETNFRTKTTSIANIKKRKYLSDIPLSLNLIFEILPLFITTLLINMIFELSIFSVAFTIYLMLITLVSIVYICLNIYNTINNASSSILNYDNEISSLMFKFNVTKQVYNDYIKELQNIQNSELEKEKLASIEILRRTVDAKDTYTRGHSDRVSKYSILIGKKLNLSKEELNILEVGGLFHDIGKIGIPDDILLKEGSLTDEEYKEIKKHPSIGAHILENSTVFENIVPIILHHHEKIDGTRLP